MCDEENDEDRIYINLKDPIHGYGFEIMSNFIEVEEGRRYLAENHFNGIVNRFRLM